MEASVTTSPTTEGSEIDGNVEKPMTTRAANDTNGINGVNALHNKVELNGARKAKPKSIRNGWFTEVEPAWPGQKLSLALEVSYITRRTMYL